MALYTVPVYVTIEAEDDQSAVDHVTRAMGRVNDGDLNLDGTKPGETGYVAWYKVGDLVPVKYEVVCYDHKLQGIEMVLPGTQKIGTRYVSDNVRVETAHCYATSLHDAKKRLYDAYGFRLGTVTLR